MEWIIRKSKPLEIEKIQEVVSEAFTDLKYSDQTEHLLVQRLMQTEAFLPSLSLVAEIDHELIGYILLTKVSIDTGDRFADSLALAPLAVKPSYQRKGVGSKLLKMAHKIASDQKHKSIIVVGDPNYYSRFGYSRCENFGILLPFDIPVDNCMAHELEPDGLAGVTGMVVYPKAFFR